jgi:hypothetical protein
LARWISPIHRIIRHIGEQIRIPAREQNRVFRRPASGFRIIIPCAKAHQPGVLIVQSAGKSERLETRIRVLCHPAPHVVVHPLRHRAISGVDHEARAAEMILDQPVGLAALDQVVGRIPAASVDEAADDLVVAVEFGSDLQGALIQKALSQDAVDFLADTPILAIDEVVDSFAAGQGGTWRRLPSTS